MWILLWLKSYCTFNPSVLPSYEFVKAWIYFSDIFYFINNFFISKKILKHFVVKHYWSSSEAANTNVKEFLCNIEFYYSGQRSDLYYEDRQQKQEQDLFKVNVNTEDSNQWHEQLHILLIFQVVSFIFWESNILYIKVYMGSLAPFTDHIWMNLFVSFIVHNCIIFHIFLLSEAVYYILGQQSWAVQMLCK